MTTSAPVQSRLSSAAWISLLSVMTIPSASVRSRRPRRHRGIAPCDGALVVALWVEFDRRHGQPAPLPVPARNVEHRPDVPPHDGPALTQHEHRVLPCHSGDSQGGVAIVVELVVLLYKPSVNVSYTDLRPDLRLAWRGPLQGRSGRYATARDQPGNAMKFRTRREAKRGCRRLTPIQSRFPAVNSASRNGYLPQRGDGEP